MMNCEGKTHQELNVLKIDGTIDNKHAGDLEIEIQKNTKYHKMDWHARSC
jgi:hypothetical protein